MPAAIFAAVGALALAGCNSHIPLPDAALLKPQPAPKCELRADGNARQQAAAPSASTTDAGPDVAAQTKLDYERQCYRHAEMIARNRLRNLQDSVQETMLALKRGESGAAKAKE